jgi:chromosomal replication initiation ATPase DnaA
MKHKLINSGGVPVLGFTDSEMSVITNAAEATEQTAKDLIYKAVMNEAHRIMSYNTSRAKVAEIIGDDFIPEKVVREFEAMVAAVTGVQHILTSYTRNQRFVYSRSILIFMMRTQFMGVNHLCPLTEIGALFTPRKDHSTMIHSYRKIMNGYCYDTILRKDLDTIKQMCIEQNRFELIVAQINKLEESYSEVKALRDSTRMALA